MLGSRRADLDAVVVAELGRRHDADLDGEGERRALLGKVAQVHLRVADGGDPGLGHRLLVPAGQPAPHGLVEHGLAADLLEDHLRGHLPAAEAGHLQLAPDRLGGAARARARARRSATSTSRRTRESLELGGGGLHGSGHAGAEDSVAVCLASVAVPSSDCPPGPSPGRRATPGARWPTSRCSGRAGCVSACWPARAGDRGGAGSGSWPARAMSPCVWRAQPRDALAVVGAREALVVPDHVAGGDPEATLERAREPQRGPELARGCRAPGRRWCPRARCRWRSS